MLTVEVMTGFDYDSLQAENAATVRQKLSEIQTLIRTRTQNAIEIGLRLIEIKQALGHGKWGKWIAAEFPGSQDTAERWMALAETSIQNPQIAEFAPSIAYELAGDESAIEAASAIVETHGTITAKQAKAVKKAAKSPTFEPGQEIYINAPEIPQHGQKAVVQSFDGKAKTFAVEVDGGVVPFFAGELSKDSPVPTIDASKLNPSQPQVRPSQAKTEPSVNPIEGMMARLEVEMERIRYLEELILKICTEYNKKGEINDETLEEAQEAIGMAA